MCMETVFLEGRIRDNLQMCVHVTTPREDLLYPGEGAGAHRLGCDSLVEGTSEEWEERCEQPTLSSWEMDALAWQRRSGWGA